MQMAVTAGGICGAYRNRWVMECSKSSNYLAQRHLSGSVCVCVWWWVEAAIGREGVWPSASKATLPLPAYWVMEKAGSTINLLWELSGTCATQIVAWKYVCKIVDGWFLVPRVHFHQPHSTCKHTDGLETTQLPSCPWTVWTLSIPKTHSGTK